jgi:acyl-coenzyme A thioesterase PaaI-like protein
LTAERAQEIRDVADAVRAVIHRMVATQAPLEVFGDIAAELRSVADRLAAYPQEPLYLGIAEAANASDGSGPFDTSPMLGRANPLAPPLRLAFEGDVVTGTAWFGSAYEGPPGCVHGGFIAAAFDELLGLAQTAGGQPGMTGRLTIHYRSPTPLRTELRLEGRLERGEGRKTNCQGSITVGGRLCAEAEGLFVAVDPTRFQALTAAREAQLGER